MLRVPVRATQQLRDQTPTVLVAHKAHCPAHNGLPFSLPARGTRSSSKQFPGRHARVSVLARQARADCGRPLPAHAGLGVARPYLSRTWGISLTPEFLSR